MYLFLFPDIGLPGKGMETIKTSKTNVVFWDLREREESWKFSMNLFSFLEEVGGLHLAVLRGLHSEVTLAVLGCHLR